MNDDGGRTKEIVKVILLVILVFAAVYAVFLLVTPKSVDETKVMDDLPEVVDEDVDSGTVLDDIKEEESAQEWEEFVSEEYNVKYLAGWLLKDEGDFIMMSGRDPFSSPERSDSVVRLIIGKVQTSRTLEEYVDVKQNTTKT